MEFVRIIFSVLVQAQMQQQNFMIDFTKLAPVQPIPNKIDTLLFIPQVSTAQNKTPKKDEIFSILAVLC